MISSILVLGILCSCSNDNDKNKNSPTLSKEQIDADSAAKLEVDAVYPKANMTNFTRISAQTGWNVYVPGEQGYRFGPTILLNGDGSIDLWTSSKADMQVGQWDWIRYKRSTDGGKTWTNDVVALKPTPNGLDQFSTCDPGVVKVGKYYYMGYTSTTDPNFIYNHVFVARSLNPEGPYEKWNGQSWGGNPQPIVWFDGPAECWGAGEPSLVVKNGVLYIYYSWTSKNADGKEFTGTRVATASALDENWPSKMEFKGTAIDRTGFGEDSLDIKFVEETGKFIGVSTKRRMTKNSLLVIYQSEDGITFTRSGNIKTNTAASLHNAGISSRPNGHIILSDQNYISYAYGTEWAKWPTMVNPIVFSESVEAIDPEAKAKNLSIEVPNIVIGKGEISGIAFEKLMFRISTYTQKTGARLYGVYNDDSLGEITDKKEITYSDYDKSVIEINSTDGTIKPLKAGMTNVTVKYKNFTDVFVVNTFMPLGPLRIEATSSSVESASWSIDKLIDSDRTSVWSSKPDTYDKWVTIKLDKAQKITGAILTPRVEGQGFPIDFNFQYSNDGSNWQNIEGQNYKNYTNPKSAVQTFNFSNSIEAQYVKITCTKLDSKVGNYFQLGEVEFFGADIPKATNLNVTVKSGKISITKKTAVQIKSFKEMGDGSISEVFKGVDGVKYTNYDQELVIVSEDGLIIAATGQKLGKTTITVSVDDKTSSFEIEVTE